MQQQALRELPGVIARTLLTFPGFAYQTISNTKAMRLTIKPFESKLWTIMPPNY